MKVTSREFTRQFPTYRNAALDGKKVEIHDRKGNRYIFQAIHTEPMSVLEAMGEWVGSVSTGKSKKTLSGYGRD